MDPTPITSQSILASYLFQFVVASYDNNCLKDCFVAINESVLIDKDIRIEDLPLWEDEGLSIPGENVLVKHFRKEVQSIMSDFVGIVRSKDRLKLASRSLDLLYAEINELYRISKLSIKLGELRNLVNVAYLIVEQSKSRKENRGVFFNKDL